MYEHYMYNVRGSFDANFEPLLSGRQLRGGRSNYVEQLVTVCATNWNFGSFPEITHKTYLPHLHYMP